MTEERKGMVGAAEAGIFYSISKGYLANMRSQKRGPRYYKVNRKVLYKWEDLEDFFTSNPVMTKDSPEIRNRRK